MYQLMMLLVSILIFCIPIVIGGYIMDKFIPEDEEVLEYEKQVRERKRARAKAKRGQA